jgi:uncharacterized protein
MSNVESVRAIYDAFGRGDFPAIYDQLADHVEWDQDAPGYGIPIYEPGVGKEHAKRFFETAAKDLEFLRFQPTNFLSGGNQVAVPIDVEVKVKPTGTVVKALEVHLWTFGDEGKVSRFFHCIDRHAFVVAYGV